MARNNPKKLRAKAARKVTKAAAKKAGGVKQAKAKTAKAR